MKHLLHILIVSFSVVANVSPSFAGDNYEDKKWDTEGKNKTLHVENYGVDSVTCGRKHNPCRSISQAIDNAYEGNTILVGPGRYGDINRDGDLDDTGEEAHSPCIYDISDAICVNKAVTVFSTNGAAATVIDVSTAPPITGAVVKIIADGVVFGAKSHGFTLLGKARQSTVLFVETSGGNVRVAGNIARDATESCFLVNLASGPIWIEHNTVVGGVCADGFHTQGSGTGKVYLRHNIARSINSGFGIIGSGAIEVVGNIAVDVGQTGFDIFGESPAVVKNNKAINTHGSGFRLNGYGHIVEGNDVIGNNSAGFEVVCGGGPPCGNISINKNNIFENDVVTTRNCGVVNSSGFEVDATNNFWGLASGPGEDPADNAGPGSGCDISGETVVTPFATKPFRGKKH